MVVYHSLHCSESKEQDSRSPVGLTSVMVWVTISRNGVAQPYVASIDMDLKRVTHPGIAAIESVGSDL